MADTTGVNPYTQAYYDLGAAQALQVPWLDGRTQAYMCKLEAGRLLCDDLRLLVPQLVWRDPLSDQIVTQIAN